MSVCQKKEKENNSNTRDKNHGLIPNGCVSRKEIYNNVAMFSYCYSSSVVFKHNFNCKPAFDT